MTRRDSHRRAASICAPLPAHAAVARLGRLVVQSITAVIAGMVGRSGMLRLIAWHLLGLYHGRSRGRFLRRILSQLTEPRLSFEAPAAVESMAIAA